MADYISSLTGVSMDQALLDMAEHNSEAYAVGERNGIAVTTDDVTYHNNARYYAQQAQSIAPASVTEAVRWDVAQTALTDANRLQARENIKATSHNYNLLDNNHFLVNSRGKSTYTASGAVYTLDRWWVSNGSTVTVNSGYIAVSCQAGGVFGQFLNNLTIGETYTASIKLNNGTVNSVTFVPNANTENVYTIGDIKLEIDTRSAYAAHPRFMFYSLSAWTTNFAAVKLEVGSFSTLAYDDIPSYGEELTRCIYSTADPTDTYANNGFGRTNPNLLDNPWFGKNEVVNQRGATSYTPTTSEVYMIDRWVAFSGSGTVGGLTNTVAGMTINNNVTGANAYIYFRQKLGTNIDLTGKVITASVMLTNGQVYYASGVVPAKTSAYQSVATIPVPNISAGFSVAPTSVTTYNYLFQLSVPSGRSIDVRAVKVELGTISTLANDVAPDYGTELLKCQRYFIRIAPTAYTTLWSGVCINASTFAFNITTPVPMRVSNAMTITFTGTLDFVEQTTSGAAIRTVTGLTAYVPVSNSNNIRVLATTGSTLGSNNLACIYTYAYTPVIDISADL